PVACAQSHAANARRRYPHCHDDARNRVLRIQDYRTSVKHPSTKCNEWTTGRGSEPVHGIVTRLLRGRCPLARSSHSEEPGGVMKGWIPRILQGDERALLYLIAGRHPRLDRA